MVRYTYFIKALSKEMYNINPEHSSTSYIKSMFGDDYTLSLESYDKDNNQQNVNVRFDDDGNIIINGPHIETSSISMRLVSKLNNILLGYFDTYMVKYKDIIKDIKWDKQSLIISTNFTKEQIINFLMSEFSEMEKRYLFKY